MLIALAAILMLQPLSSEAQIRLFPGKGNPQVLDTLKLLPVDSLMKVQVMPADTAVAEIADTANAADTTAIATDVADTAATVQPIVFSAPERVRVSLVLPLTGAEKGNYTDFYCGFLMGVKKLAEEGAQIDLFVSETGNDAAYTEDCHLSIDASPASALGENLERSVKTKAVVVPLEQDTDKFTAYCPVVLMSGNWKSRIRNMVQWIKEDKAPEDSLFVIVRDDRTDQQTFFLMCELVNNDIPFKVTSSYMSQKYDRIQGKAMFAYVVEDALTTASVVNFLSGPVKKLKEETAFYCTSKVRSYSKRFEEDALNNANTKMVSSYYIDYSSPQTDSFILEYRRLFGAEPNMFSFHGYDTALCFIPLAAEYGENWPAVLDTRKGSGMISDFAFTIDATGWVNSAFRRISYLEGLEEKLEKSNLTASEQSLGVSDSLGGDFSTAE